MEGSIPIGILPQGPLPQEVPHSSEGNRTIKHLDRRQDEAIPQGAVTHSCSRNV